MKDEAGPKARLQKDKSNAPTSKSRNNNDFLLKMKLGRRPGFKRTSPMLPHSSLETSSNQQTISVYERPASMKTWRVETMLSQDCSRDCQGIWKWRVQRPITQVQKHYDLLLTMKLGRRPSFKRARFVIKIAGPQTQLQKDKSNAPASKSGINNDFLPIWPLFEW